MKTRVSRWLSTFSILAAVTFVLSASCGGCSDEVAAPGTGFDTQECASDSDCLGSCANGVCTGGGSTGFDGEACTDDGDCRGSCDGAVCTGAGTGD